METVCYYMEELKCPVCDKVLLVLDTPGSWRGEVWRVKGQIMAACTCSPDAYAIAPSPRTDMLRYLYAKDTKVQFIDFDEEGSTA